MKKNKFLALTFSTMATVVLASQANAFDVNASALKLINTLGQKDPATLCRKGDAFKRIFSLRSFEGEFGSKSRTLANFGGVNCTRGTIGDAAYEEFLKSSFVKKAVSKGYLTLQADGDIDVEAAQAGLEEGVRKNLDKGKELVCKHKEKFANTPVAKVADKVC